MLIFVVIFFLSFFFVRKIPDYSRDYGYRYVFLNDYEKNKAKVLLVVFNRETEVDLEIDSLEISK